jgi:hypothetical protein
VYFLKRHFQILAVAAVLPIVAVASGCGSKDDSFAKVNGAVITKAEYMRALERAPVTVAQNVQMPAERMIIDQLIGKKVLAAEAGKLSVTPTEEEINRVYNIQKQLFDNAQPGKKYDEEMQKQGASPESIKDEIRGQLAEAAVLAKMLNLGDSEVKKFYEDHRDEFGLPARTQVRLILLDPASPKFAEAQKRLADKSVDFTKAAKELNVISGLKVTSGLQVFINSQIPPNLQAPITQAAEGVILGPLDWTQQPVGKIWVKVEKKLPQFSIPVEEALPLVRIRIVRERIASPENAKIRNDIMKLKLDAKFEPTDATYSPVWEATRQQALDAGLGQAPEAAAPPAGAAPAPAGAAPAGAPKAPGK